MAPRSRSALQPLPRSGRRFPFLFREVASVGFLASAAAIAGFIPLAEYEIVKRGADDKRGKVDGGADYWSASDQRAYSFEFKRALVSATPANLSAVLADAFGDIARIQRDECHHAADGLIARAQDSYRVKTYYDFADWNEVDLTCQIGPKGEDGAFLFFRLVPVLQASNWRT